MGCPAADLVADGSGRLRGVALASLACACLSLPSLLCCSCRLRWRPQMAKSHSFAVTGPNSDVYEALRREFLSDEELKPLLPTFVSRGWYSGS